MDYLSGRSLNVGSMDVNVTSVQFNGNQAEALVSFTPKGGSPEAGMSMRYELAQKGNGWVVVGRKDSGQNPHGGAAMPGSPNPHGAGTMPQGNPHEGMAMPQGGPGAGGSMPSPQDLPPASGNK